MLREAHAKAMKDSELLADAKKTKMDVKPSTGEELQALAQEVTDLSSEAIEGSKKLLGK